MLQDDLGGYGDARLRRAGAKLLDAMCQKPVMGNREIVQLTDSKQWARFVDLQQI